MTNFIPLMLDAYFQAANERHRIYLKRQAGEDWPWTENPIFTQYKFTNVYRELDKGTLWLKLNWRERFAYHPMLFFNICLYRQFNWIPTAVQVGFLPYWNADSVYQQIKEWRDDHVPSPRQIYTNAHMVRGPQKKDGYKEKLRYTIYCVLDPLYTNEAQFIPQPGDTLQAAFERLVKAYGFGGFGAYEVISDLRWTRYLQDATDSKVWANAGPGAVRGLNRLLGIKAKASMRQQVAVEHMQELLALSKYRLADYMPEWEMREVEHWLCEFDKYERVRLGQGRPRVTFKPPHLR